MTQARLIDHLRSTLAVSDPVLAAMQSLDRRHFIPAPLHHQAFEDKALPIGRGQTISQPSVVALMTEALEITPSLSSVLEIGTGSGYQSAILARLARRVYTIERHKPLGDMAQILFDRLSLRNITAVVGDGMKGWPVPGVAPFDRIIVTAAARHEPPPALVGQLDVGGIMILPLVDPDGSEHLYRLKRESADVTARHRLLPVRFVPLLPDVEG